MHHLTIPSNYDLDQPSGRTDLDKFSDDPVVIRMNFVLDFRLFMLNGDILFQ